MCFFVRTAVRLATENWRLRHELEVKDEQIAGLCHRLRRIQDDVELLGAAIPREKRGLALSLVRDRHRIQDGEIIEEVGG